MSGDEQDKTRVEKERKENCFSKRDSTSNNLSSYFSMVVVVSYLLFLDLKNKNELLCSP